MCGQMMPGHQISWIYILIALRAYGQYLILTKLYALVRLDHIMWCLLLSCRYWEKMNTSGHQIATSLTNKPRVQDWCWLIRFWRKVARAGNEPSRRLMFWKLEFTIDSWNRQFLMIFALMSKCHVSLLWVDIQLAYFFNDVLNEKPLCNRHFALSLYMIVNLLFFWRIVSSSKSYNYLANHLKVKVKKGCGIKGSESFNGKNRLKKDSTSTFYSAN